MGASLLVFDPVLGLAIAINLSRSVQVLSGVCCLSNNQGRESLCLFRIDEHDPLYGTCWALSFSGASGFASVGAIGINRENRPHYPKIEKSGAKLIVGSCFAAGAALGAISNVIRSGNGQCPRMYLPLSA
jgi:hypothetical protein